MGCPTVVLDLTLSNLEMSWIFQTRIPRKGDSRVTPYVTIKHQ